MGLPRLLEQRTPKGGGGRGGRGGGSGGSSGGGSSGGSSGGSGGGSSGGSSGGGSRRPTTTGGWSDNRTSGRINHRPNTGTSPVWFLALPVWARVLIVFGIIWGIFFLCVFVKAIFEEVGRVKQEGKRFNIFRVLRRTIFCACGIDLILRLVQNFCPCGGRSTKKKGDTFYEKVDNAERGQLDDDSSRKSLNEGRKEPPSPTLAPSPISSPVMKPAAVAK